MAFNIRFFGRISSTANDLSHTLWGYTNTDDTLGTIGALGYFNKLISDLASGYGKIDKGDVIVTRGSDGNTFFLVTHVTTNVGTVPYLSEKRLGDWDTKTVDTDYEGVAVDMYVIARVASTAAIDKAGIIAETPIGTVRAKSYADNVIPGGQILFPVKANESWKVTSVWVEGSPTYEIFTLPVTPF